MSRVEFQRRADPGVFNSGVDVLAPGIAATRFVQRFNPWQWCIIIIPSLLAALYFFAIASDQYMSEARFIVRSPNGEMPTILGSVLQSTGLQRSTDDATNDAYAVQSYMTSRDAINALERNDHLRDIFNREGADFITRFPNWISGSTFEALYRHSQHFVDVEVDNSSGIITLQVKAYRPEDAQVVARALLRYSEQMVNNLNARAETDSLAEARKHVDEAEDRLSSIERQLTAFRISNKILDPKLDSTGLYTTLSGIMAQRAETATQLAELVKGSPGSPAIPGLKTRLAALNTQLDESAQKITGGSNSIADKAGNYESSSLSESVAAKILEAAIQSLETAETEAQRQHLYIEHIAEPNLPDYAIYPRRILDFSVAVLSFLIVYGIFWLMLAGVREHSSA